jgi:predicted nucleic acid-binding protein
MTAECFIDTNLFIYQLEALDARKTATADRIIRLYQRALDIQARYHYGFYGALIIAAALEAGCTRLYSEDLQHGQLIERLTIENPFLEG